MNPATVHNIEDLRALARARLPRIVYEFLEGGAEEELTLHANREAFERIRFAPRILVDVSQRSQQTSVLGKRFDSPFGIAPTGAAGLFCHRADLALARAARFANVPFVLSTQSFIPLARVAQEVATAPWFQLYMSENREAAKNAVSRALDAGCDILVLTADVPVGGNREYNERNGFGFPFHLGLKNVADGLLHPRWLASVFLRSYAWGNLPEWGTRRDRITWDSFAWLRGLWPGKLLLKGVLTVEDAQLAAQHGADGIVVSNHGGRQLDGAPSPIEVLPQIAAAVDGKIAVVADGGFRRGSDIVKALALGADLVLVGRAALYGAAAAGETGIRRALQILKSEVDRVLALIGCSSVAELGPQYLHILPKEIDRTLARVLPGIPRKKILAA